MIKNLNKIDCNNSKKYNYKNVNFLYKPNLKNKSCLTVFLHGKCSLTEEPIYRGYNYTFENSSVLCLSDGLRQYYKQNYCWYLSTKKHNYEDVYLEILNFFNNKYDIIIFTGTSAGGYFSLYLAGVFNQYALISNSQIFLPNYYKLPTSGYNQMVRNIKENDSIIYKDICEHFNNNKPKKIYLFCNQNDKPAYRDATKLLQHLNRININVVDNIFIGREPGKDKNGTDENNHTIQFPKYDHKYYVNELINKIVNKT